LNWTPEQVEAACQQYGPEVRCALLKDSSGRVLNGARLLYALAMQESSLGTDCGPRFEPGYWDGDESRDPIQAALNTKYGKAAAMSYGPWQVMYVNCATLGAPEVIDSNLGLCATAAVDFVNTYVIASQHATNLQEVARIYNSGNKTEPMTLGVLRYVENVSRFYDRAHV
jgi:hypothetical protein